MGAGGRQALLQLIGDQAGEDLRTLLVEMVHVPEQIAVIGITVGTRRFAQVDKLDPRSCGDDSLQPRNPDPVGSKILRETEPSPGV